MTAHLLWPTYLWEEYEDPTIALALAEELLPEDQVLQSCSDVRPWASDDLLHDREEWSFVRDRVLETAARFAEYSGILYSNLYITSMWVNAQYQRQNHVAHTHPNSLFSGVWYLDTPPGSQCFMLYDPRPASSVIKPRTTSPQGNIGIAARRGTILMWPSWLQHSTQSITVDELDRARIALAFNVMLRDSVDDHSARINYL